MSNYKINIESIYPGIKVRKKQIKDLVQILLTNEGIVKAKINIILVGDRYIIKLNQQFLNKQTTTDVLSFCLSDENDAQLEGEVYANIEQIIRQADEYHLAFNEELSRIVIHGLLHLIGFNDQTDEDKQVMTQKENQYLAILQE